MNPAVFAGTPEIKIQSRWIGQVERVVSDVGIAVQSLRVLGMTAHWIGRHEPNHAGGIVSSSKVIEAALRIPFFAGEFAHQRRMLDMAVVHEGQCVVGVDRAFGGSSTTLKVTARSVAWNLIARCP